MVDQGNGQERPAGWKRDPSGRHYGRYWDGERWTDQVVSADKVRGIDPLPETQRPRQAEVDSEATRLTPAAAAPTEVMSAPAAFRGPVPTAPGWTPGSTRSRRAVPLHPNPDDPRGRGKNQVLDAVRAWPSWAKWAAGTAVVLVLLAAAAGGGEDGDRPVSVVGDVQTTLTLPAATTAAPTTEVATTIPATTQAPTTVTTPATTQAPAPATTAATAPATTAATAPATTAARPIQQGVTPGAFCASGGASGLTTTGVAMTCTTSATDSRNRWRAA
jgi:hypothetical protein